MFFRTLLFLLLIISTASATIIYIPEDHNTIQEGINASANGDTVLVADGVYSENINFNGRLITLASEFIIDADSSHINFTMLVSSRYFYAITLNNEENEEAKIIGFSISQGWGGIYCNNSSPYIAHNLIHDNFIDDYELGGIGAGIRCENSSATIEFNTISNNKIFTNLGFWSGGGIACLESDLEIRNNKFLNNNCYQGGAMFIRDSSPIIEDNIFSGNIAYYGSAIDCEQSSPQLINNLFYDNEVSIWGTICLLDNSDALIEGGSIFENRRALAPYGIGITPDGSGIYVEESNPVIGTVSNPVSIYNNEGCYGRDIFLVSSPDLDVYVDTFTVINPDKRLVFPIDQIDFSIEEGINPPIGEATEIFVSPRGHNSNTGLNDDEALRSIELALLRLPLTEETNTTLHLMEGVFSDESSGQDYPLYLHENLNFAGVSDQVILEGDAVNNILQLKRGSNISINKLNLRNGHTAIHTDSSVSVEINNCELSFNYVGAIFAESFSSLIIHGNHIHNNTNDYLAGGIELNFCSFSEVYNNLVENNTSGAVKFYGTPGIIRNNDIRSNNDGGFYFKAGGLMVRNVPNSFIIGRDSVYVLNNLIYDNIVENCEFVAGGLNLKRVRNCLVANNTIVSNQISGSQGDKSGGVYISQGYVEFQNNIVYDNLDNLEMDNIFVADSSIINYNLIQGGFEGTGNFDAYPEFIDTDNFYLEASSPAIDSGSPEIMFNDIEDSTNPGFAMWPSLGTIRNDVGCYGGPFAAVDLYLNINNDENKIFIPEKFKFGTPYPNPFNSYTTLQIDLPFSTYLKLRVYDLLGREVSTISSSFTDAGTNNFVFNAVNLASGTYFIKAETRNWNSTRKVVLIK